MGDERVWGISMVRDEVDVVEGVVRHMASEGVDGILVADNLSRDGTSEDLADLVGNIGCELVVVADLELAYYQSAKMTRLMREAAERGADWVIPFDADEIWSAKDPMPLAQALRALPDRTAFITADLYNHFGMPSDDPTEVDPFVRIRNRDPAIGSLPKIACRTNRRLIINQGNHTCEPEEGAPYAPSGGTLGTIRHFSWRSPEQFEKKVRNGAEAYAASDLPDSLGGHWRQYGAILDANGPAALRDDVFYRWFFDPPETDLIDDPAPYKRWLNP